MEIRERLLWVVGLAVLTAVPLIAAEGPLQGGAADSSSHLPVLLAASMQQNSRDPLTTEEVDQLRETAQEPDKRLKLLADFARARMAAVDQVQGIPETSSDRGQQMHDRLQSLGSIIDEIDDNLDDYDQKNLDMRKGLKEIIDADSEFQVKVKALTEAAAPGGRDARAAQDYSFVLEDLSDSVKTQLDSARAMLQDQEKRVQEAKEKKKEKK